MSSIILQPVISEKSFEQAENGVYTFRVDRSVNKKQIEKEVESRFNVTVEKVNIINRKGKKVVDWNRRVTSRRKDFKKAIVTLKAGDTIEVFKQ